MVERVGDVDSDGMPDFAVGAPFSDEVVNFGVPIFVADAGAVSVYSGTTGQLIWKAVGPIGGNTEFGAAIAAAGDVNLDGHDDVLVGLPASNGLALQSGTVKLLSGADGSVLRTYFGSQTGERYGAALCAGHMDTDYSSPEAAIGAPHHDMGGTSAGLGQEGRIEVVDLWSGAVKIDLVGHWLQWPGDFGFNEFYRGGFGTQVAYVGDRDSDGYGSLVVSAPFTEFIEHGPGGTTSHALAGLVQLFEPLNPATNVYSGHAYTGAASDLLGLHLEALPDDFNGDGKTDWLTYAQGSNTLRLYHDSAVPAVTMVNPCFEGLRSVASVGDLNLDGTPDLAVGVPGLGSSVGRVCLVSGNSGSVLKTLLGSNAAARYGTSVAGADMDGDGSAELWIGAPYDDTAHTNAGAVYVRTESSCFISASWYNYGSALAGTLGAPTLTLFSDPVQGTHVGVHIGSVTTFQTQALLLIGETSASIPIFGGVVAVMPFEASFLTLPINGSNVALWIPEQPAYCGATFYLQALQRNPDTPAGWAISSAVQLTVGS